MITALSVKIPERRRGVRGWAQRLRGDRVEVQTKEARGVTLRHVVYTSYSGELRLEKTFRAVGSGCGSLLCSERLIFPRASGYRRFSSTAFSARLCANFALAALSRCQSAASLRIGIYDPAAVCADLLYPLLERCNDVAVVTAAAAPYLCEAQRALEEMGAAALVTKSRSALEDRDLIIAPQRVEEPLALHEAVLLTAAKPDRETGGVQLYRYRFRMPNGFDQIKPHELSEEYFCSALYTLGAQYALGSIVPLSAGGNRAEYTPEQLAKWLDKRKQKEYNN